MKSAAILQHAKNIDRLNSRSYGVRRLVAAFGSNVIRRETGKQKAATRDTAGESFCPRLRRLMCEKACLFAWIFPTFSGAMPRAGVALKQLTRMEKGKAFLHIRRRSRKEKNSPAVSQGAALQSFARHCASQESR
jgi:hypothetical protein